MALNYVDFDIEIDHLDGLNYRVNVRSPVGDMHTVMLFPYESLELQNQLLLIQNALLGGRSLRRRAFRPGQDAIREFGHTLFNALFGSEVRSLFFECRRIAEAESGGVRLNLRFLAPELAVLPWEFLYDERSGGFIGLERKTPIVRTLEIPQPIQPLAVTPPLRILGIIATPADLPPLDVNQERQRLEAAMHSLKATRMVELAWLERPTWRELQRTLRRGPWHVLHFVGHGAFDHMQDEGLIILENEERQAHKLTASQLGMLLANHGTLRMVILNACEGAQASPGDVFSSTAATLLRRGIPAVIAMQYEISDQAAIEFTTTFYEALADGMPVDAAVSEARVAVCLALQDCPEWGTPVVYLRAPDGIVFSLSGQQPSIPPAPIPPAAPPEPITETSPNTHRSAGAPASAASAAHRTATADGQLRIDWITIPAGETLIGSDPDQDPSCASDEQPQHRLYIAEFRIARTPITNSQYQRFVEATGASTPAHWRHGQIPPGKEMHPVVNVSWQEAQAFCAWANVRLPSEAEWEKAARGEDGRLYPWGNELPNPALANFDHLVDDTTPVAQYERGASPFGVLDMAGNVLEWTVSLWGSNPGAPQFAYPYDTDDGREEIQAPGKSMRVVRGGAFNLGSICLRCAFRSSAVMHHGRKNIGFRVAV